MATNHNVISQEQLIINQHQIHTPQITNNSYVFYTDSVYNIDRIYSNKYYVETETGYTYYGLRTVSNNKGEFNSYGMDNINISKVTHNKVEHAIYYFDQPQNFLVTSALQGTTLFAKAENTYEYLFDEGTEYPKYTYAYFDASTVINLKQQDASILYEKEEDDSICFDLKITLGNELSYVPVEYNDTSVKIFYEKDFVPLYTTSENNGHNSGVLSEIASNKVYEKIKDEDTQDVIFKRTSFLPDATNVSDYENLYVENLTFSDITDKTTLTVGDEYYVKPQHNNVLSYLQYRVGVNDSDMLYGLTFVKIKDPKTTITDEFIQSNTIYNCLSGVRLIKTEDEFNTILKNGISNIYTIDRYTINRIDLSKNTFSTLSSIIDTSGKTVYLTQDPTTKKYVVIPLSTINNNTIFTSGSAVIWSTTLEPSLNLVDDSYVWEENVYYVKTSSNEYSYFEIENNLISNEFTGDLFIYEINAISTSVSDYRIVNILNDNLLQLYKESYLYNDVKTADSIATGDALYYTEIDKTTLSFIDTSEENKELVDWYAGESNYVESKDIIKIASKNYYGKIEHEINTIYNFKLKSECENIIKTYSPDVSYTILNAYKKYIADSYNLNENVDITNPEKFFAGTSYIQYVKTKYLYNHLTNNTGVEINAAGTMYTNIEVYDSATSKKSIKIPVHKKETFNTSYVYVEKTEKYIQLYNESDLTSTNNEDYYIKHVGSKYYKRLTNIDESPLYYLKHDSYNIYIKEIYYTDVPYNANNYGTTNVHTQYCDTSYNPICISIGNDDYAVYGTNNSISLYGGYNGKQLELVQLYAHVYNDGSTVQQQYNTANHIVSEDKPLYVANEFTYVDTGTYTWNPPTFVNNIEVKDGTSYWNTYMQTEGFWTKNYEKQKNNLEVSSYVFYVNNEDSVSRTYTMMPSSSIIQSVVNYPKIEYKTKLPFSKETEYFTYQSLDGNGLSYVYNDNRYVFENGSYWGIVNGQKIQLSKASHVKTGITVGNFVEQDEHVEYTYFTYTSALQLANEKIPVLIETTIKPDLDEVVMVWDDEIDSYVTTTVKKSLSYYSYEYILKDNPFLVSSVVSQDDEFEVKDITTLSSYVGDLVSYFNTQTATANEKYESISSGIVAHNEATTSAADKISNTTKTGFDEFNQNLIETTKKLENQLSNINVTLSALSPLTVNQAMSALGYEAEETEAVDNSNKHGVIKGTKIRTALGTDSYKLIENIKIGDNILSFRKSTGENYISTVKNVQTFAVNALAKILLVNGKYVVIGENTPVLTDDGFKTLTNIDYPELTKTDKVVTIDGSIAIDSIERFNNATNENIYFIDVVKNGNNEHDNFFANDICVHNIEISRAGGTTGVRGLTSYTYSYILSGTTSFNVNVENLSEVTSVLQEELSKEKTINVKELNTYLTDLSNAITKNTEECFTYLTDSLNNVLNTPVTVSNGKTSVQQNATLAYLLLKHIHYTDSYCFTPYKNAFIADTSKRLFAAVDFENEVIDSVEYDSDGNITNKITHKNNPSEIAKRSIMRANILWKELEKSGYVKE